MGAIQDLTITAKTREGDDARVINLTGFDMRTLAKKVYDLSRPQGMGFLQFRDGTLTDQELDELVNDSEGVSLALTMDYVFGRACKFHVQRADGPGVYLEFPDGVTHFTRTDWYDHSEYQFEELLSACRPGNE